MFQLAGWLAGRLAGWMDASHKNKSCHAAVATAQKSGLAARYFEYRGAFKAKVGREDETARGCEINQQDAARQSKENVSRIGAKGSFEVVEKI